MWPVFRWKNSVRTVCRRKRGDMINPLFELYRFPVLATDFKTCFHQRSACFRANTIGFPHNCASLNADARRQDRIILASLSTSALPPNRKNIQPNPMDSVSPADGVVRLDGGVIVRYNNHSLIVVVCVCVCEN